MNGQNGSIAPRAWLEWILIISLAGGAGVGSSMIVPRLAPEAARPDPFTGTMGRELENRLEAKIREVDQAGSKPMRQLEARVGALEGHRAEIVQRLSRIEELLIELRVHLGKRQP